MSSQPKAETQLASLQILRAIAALMVYVFHYGAGLVSAGALTANPFEIGAFGVDIFFVVSGFIICLASERETSPVRFWIKRVCRVVPVYWALTLCVFLIAMVAPGLLGRTVADPVHLLKSLAFIPYARVDGSVQPLLFLGWTLNYEIFFYLIFAFCLNAGKLKIPLCMAIMVALVVAGAVFDPSSVLGQFYTSGVILNFVWGCLAYLAWRALGERARSFAWVWVLGAGLLVLTAIVPPGWPREYVYGLPSMVLLIGLVSVNPGQGVVSSFMQRVGDASYSLYLIHPYVIRPVLMIIVPIAGLGFVSLMLATILSLGATIILSLLSFAYVERPSNLFLRRLFLAQREARS